MSFTLLFPGQGSQYVGMGASFFSTTAGARLAEEAESALGFSLTKIMLSGSQEDLTSTAIAQPAILLHSIAAFKVLKERHSLEISCAIGHSLGEYSALVAAGVIKFSDAIKAVHVRGRLMQEAVPKGQGAMAAVLGMDATKICEIIKECANNNQADYVAAANFNGPLQTVIAGTKDGVAKASAKLKLAGAKRIIELDVSAPFHCALMKPVQQRMTAVLDGIQFSDAIFPIISNVSAQRESKANRIKTLLIEQITSPVRFTECVETVRAHHLGPNGFIELGPKNALSGLVKKIDGDMSLRNIDKIDDLNNFSL